MQALSQTSALPAASDDAVMAQLSMLREKLKGHKNNARAAWDACTPVETVQNPTHLERVHARVTMGDNTRKLLGE